MVRIARNLCAVNSPLPGTLPAHITARLARENIRNCGDWLALERRRFLIFGLTRKMAVAVDQAVAEALR